MLHYGAIVTVRPIKGSGGSLDGFEAVCGACGDRYTTSLSEGFARQDAADHVNYMLRKERAAVVPGAYIEYEQRTKDGVERAVVKVRHVDPRDGYLYVTWTNAQPDGGWDRRIGQHGTFRFYPAPRTFGTDIIRVIG